MIDINTYLNQIEKRKQIKPIIDFLQYWTEQPKILKPKEIYYTILQLSKPVFGTVEKPYFKEPFSDEKIKEIKLLNEQYHSIRTKHKVGWEYGQDVYNSKLRYVIENKINQTTNNQIKQKLITDLEIVEYFEYQRWTWFVDYIKIQQNKLPTNYQPHSYSELHHNLEYKHPNLSEFEFNSVELWETHQPENLSRLDTPIHSVVHSLISLIRGDKTKPETLVGRFLQYCNDRNKKSYKPSYGLTFKYGNDKVSNKWNDIKHTGYLDSVYTDEYLKIIKHFINKCYYQNK